MKVIFRYRHGHSPTHLTGHFYLAITTLFGRGKGGKETLYPTVRPKSINAVSRANFGIVIGVHPSTLQIKKIIYRPRPTLGPIDA